MTTALILPVLLLQGSAVPAPPPQPAPLPPAVPLITLDPYISVWSFKDRLTDDWPRHWTNTIMGLCGMVRVDGHAWRWCGMLPQGAPAAAQLSCQVDPSATIYTFAAGGVELDVRFQGLAWPGASMEQMARTAAAVLCTARSTDGKTHDVQLYMDVTGEWCSESSDEQVNWCRLRGDGMQVARMGTVQQPVLGSSGDWKRIDWGYLYLAAPDGDVTMAPHAASRAQFMQTGAVAQTDDTRMPRAVSDDWPVLAASASLGKVGASPAAQAAFLLAYDQVRCIQLFERPLRPLWQAYGMSAMGLLKEAKAACAQVTQRGADGSPSIQHRDRALLSAAQRVGGPQYAALIAAAFRQVLAGHALAADWDSTPLMFSKENTSNGCIGTVDVIFPAAPFYLYENPELLKASLRPLLQYASSARWPFPFAPHDLGTYPLANGQVYGGGERSEENQMPVEETGNMLIMLAALAKLDGNASFAAPYLPMLERWATYLRDHGIDPVNQLCTDDFAGHLARNANLSAKACVALGAYAQILKAAGNTEAAARWRSVAEGAATKWMELAASPNGAGKPTVLAFGAAAGADTWSQKYNLVWDKALGLGLFPDSVFRTEMDWYKSHLGRYGLPLDNRATYTKLDWCAWTACLTQSRADFDAIMQPIYAWFAASPRPSRVPLSDWFQTTDGTTKGMFTRTVVGGLWMPLLLDKMGAGWGSRSPAP